MVHHFLRACKPLQNVDFSKVGNMLIFFRNCTHILTGTQGKKFEVMFLVKIASKGTSLIENKMREGCEATGYFCIVAHSHLAGRRLAAIGRADDCFCRF